MHQNIKNNNVKSIDAKLYSAKYYDFMLYKGETFYQDGDILDSMTFFDFSDLNIVNGKLYSNKVWSGATNNGVILNDIGYTGMDNGLISFRKDRITNADFLELLVNSKYIIDSGDTRLFLTPVTGNTQMYDYPMYLYENDEEKYIVCNGGFYQGFFKLYGHDYEVLPNKLDNEWFMHFELRPRSDYDTPNNTVNYTHKENEGIFFFMGLRAENKFWPFYKTNSAVTQSMAKGEVKGKDYFDGCGESGATYDVNENNVVFLENDWLMDEPKEEEKYNDYFAVGDGYFVCELSGITKEYIQPNKTQRIFEKSKYPSASESLNVYDYNSYSACDGGNEGPSNTPNMEEDCACEYYFTDEYFDDRCPQSAHSKFVVDEYIGSGVTIVETGYEDSDGHKLDEYGVEEILTDNKFLMFDRTASGFTVDKWEEGTEIILTRRQQWPNANYFLLMNRTSTGYSVDTIQKYNEANEYDYSIHKDIMGNVFALRVKEDGSIGYRYGIFDCDSENKYKVVEEYSKPGLVKTDQWNSINVRYSLIGESRHKCDERGRKMKIYIYVNGFLVFISKELDAFIFKHIEKECSGKQESVPYNISLGGGSLGLLETIMPNYYAISDYILPIEKDFCGTFIGDIKAFKMYGGFVEYNTIKNNLT